MAVTLGSKPVGSIVKLKEDGVLQNYIVVHQGKPSSIYDESCNGTWLLRQYCLQKQIFNASNPATYENSPIYAWLNSTMFNKYDVNIKEFIKQVKIPYRKNGGLGGYDVTGSDGLSCKIFLLSAREVGGGEVGEGEISVAPYDGSKLSYFPFGNDANSKRIALLDGTSTKTIWWLRSLVTNSKGSTFAIPVNGEVYYYNSDTYLGTARPAFIMPSDEVWVEDDGSLVTNTAPSTPSSISFSNIVNPDNKITITWGASTDEQGDTIKYQLERSTNGSSSWTKVYDGELLTYTDTVNADWNTVQYRVRAYDTENLYSAYTTSENKTVLRLNISQITVPSLAMQEQPIPISWLGATDADSYTLERNADSSEWESIYTGSDTSYTDTAGTWNTVQYRVKASNNGSFGSYKTSTAIPVITPNALVISGEDSDLGTLVNNIPYTVSTDTGNTISLERYVNGQLIAKLEVNSGFSYTIPVIDLPTGTGTIKLVASVETGSGLPVNAERIWTYKKTPVSFPDSGGVGMLTQDGKNVFPPTIAECVRVSAQFGRSLDKALELIAPLLNMAVMAVGSYVGSGTFGADSPNTLTFDFSPQMVIISGGNRSLTISNTIKTEGGTVGYIEGTKVTWYNSNSADEQLNQSDVNYTYIAIGEVQT